MCQGQLRVIIYIYFVELEYIMLHAKFHHHRTISSVGEDFLRFFTIYGHDGHLGHVTWTIYINFLPPSHGGSTWNLVLIGQVISEKKMFENNGDIHVYSPGAGTDNPLG